MKNTHITLLLLLLVSLKSYAEINVLYPRHLTIQNREMFQAPPQMTVDNIETWVKNIQKLKHHAYVDLGDYTDLMHGHVLFKLKNEVTDTNQDNLSNLPFDSDRWNDYEAVAILFHTQEYGFMRNEEGFKGRFGELDILARNWIMLLKGNGYGKAGDIIDANLVSEISRSQGSRIYTVFPYKLIPSFYKTDFSTQHYSFYFFKVSCDEVNLHEIIKTNIVRINDEGKELCLLVQSEKCKNRSCGNYRSLKHVSKYYQE